MGDTVVVVGVEHTTLARGGYRWSICRNGECERCAEGPVH